MDAWSWVRPILLSHGQAPDGVSPEETLARAFTVALTETASGARMTLRAHESPVEVLIDFTRNPPGMAIHPTIDGGETLTEQEKGRVLAVLAKQVFWLVRHARLEHCAIDVRSLRGLWARDARVFAVLAVSPCMVLVLDRQSLGLQQVLVCDLPWLRAFSPPPHIISAVREVIASETGHRRLNLVDFVAKHQVQLTRAEHGFNLYVPLNGRVINRVLDPRGNPTRPDLSISFSPSPRPK